MDDWRKDVFSLRPGHVPSLFAKQGSRAPEGREFESVLVLDSWRPHKDKDFITKLKEENGVEIVIILGGMTPLLQPADITWNKEVKRKFKDYWREWMITRVESEDDKIKRPEYKQIIEWVYNAWYDLDRQIIIDSFKSANLGSDSNEIDIHSRLKEVINNSRHEETEQLSLTDTESESELIVETLDLDGTEDSD